MFYYPNSYGNTIGFLNMSWSTILDESNGLSVIKFRVYLDKWFVSYKGIKFICQNACSLEFLDQIL